MARSEAIPTVLSPEQRRRQSLTRRPVFTVSAAGSDVQRRFVVRSRTWFLALVSAQLAAAFGALLWLPALPPGWLWPLAGGAALLLIGSALIGRRSRLLSAVAFILGWLAAGLAVGFWLPGGSGSLAILLDAAILVGGLVLGTVINGLWFVAERSAFREFLLTGPWLVVALGGAWLVPGGEWPMAVSGLLGLLWVYCLLRSRAEAFQIFQPGEALVAATDSIHLALAASFRWLSGRD